MEGMRIETQNVLGSRETDFLRLADWFFPEGMNPHELMAGVPGAGRVLQGLARRVAGLGQLPSDAPLPARQPARRRDVDVLVGPAGMAATVELAARGRQVEVVDDDLAWGGCLRALPAESLGEWQPLRQKFAELKTSARAAVRARTTALGIYGDDVLVAASERGDEGLEVIKAKSLVLAPGAHDGAIAFEGNDVPGVISARAGCRLLAHGVIVGSRVALAQHDRGTVFGQAYARARAETRLLPGIPLRASGSTRVRHVTVQAAGGPKRLSCDALLVDAPGAPAFELCVQAGGAVERCDRGFVVKPNPGGVIRDGVFAIGEVVGTPLEPAAILADAAAMAAHAG
jgi:sarcosine oxidase subunit alpha